MRYYINMEKVSEKKRGAAAIFALCPARHILTIVSAALILLHLFTRYDKDLMRRVSDGVVQPIHRWLSGLTAALPFSLAEVLICAGIAAVVVYIMFKIIVIIRGKDYKRQVYITIITLASALLAVYAAFCMLWGVYYYGDDFAEKSGISGGDISVEQLETVTEYFAYLANEYAPQVARDENGVCAIDRAEVLKRSDEVFLNTQERLPCLAGKAVKAKGVFLSRAMSYIDFTGFFFPLTAEANVNMDFPPSLFAATVAHELSHQRGVAKEQEANFTAVMACLDYGDKDYCYSACLMAYTYLGNALRSVDREAWQRIYSTLCPEILADFKANSEYWARFDTPVQSVSNTVYEGFLQSYDQKLGLKSYGACVDLLVNYYYEAAREYFAAV